MMRRARTLLLTAVASLSAGSTADVGPDVSPGATRQGLPANPEYTGRFVFSRVRYHSVRRRRWGGSAWSHDYPRADQHLSRILDELTLIPTETRDTNVFDLDDPQLFRHPIAYISEPGDWDMTDEQAQRLREYVLKGGFLIFDDFERNQFDNMAYQLRRALPEVHPIQIGPEHPIFGSFFKIEDIYFPHPLVPVTPIYWGLFEDNDPTRRMFAIINHNNDIAEYWEFSDRAWFPVDITNDAYKLGINYVVWGLSH
ncbi:MAG: DUF4159 domain-containing protein [Gemmatimonadota bacterium]